MKVLVLLMVLGISYGVPFSSPCTEEEMLQPIADFEKIVDEMKSPGVDHEQKIEEIQNTIVKDGEAHANQIDSTCGDEKNQFEEKVSKFYDNLILGPARVGLVLVDNDYNKAIKLFEAVHCKHMLLYLITSTSYTMEGLGPMIEVVKRMDDPKKINDMHEAIIYSLSSKNINDGKLLVPILKDHIIANANNDEIVKNAKLNLKTLADRTSSYYPDAVNALNEVQ